MKRFVLLLTIILAVLPVLAQRVIFVQKGDVQSLLSAIDEANKLNAAKDAERTFIMIPDGFYDLGTRTLTRITGHNLAFVGQSMAGTVIQNAPGVEMESISKTAVFQNRGTGNYFQDLTLKNGMDYYTKADDARAVCLQDKGNRTICNRVRMLSHQDTYYSDNEKSQHYFSDSEIHGTVYFICGAGDVWFERCRIVTEKRHADGSGCNVIAAPRTSETPWGYVFSHCTVENDRSTFHYARAWHTSPRCVWMYTTLLTPEKLEASRFDLRGMKISSNYFKEYRTVDAMGRDITPRSHVVTFTLRDMTNPFTAETIMTEEEAKRYTLKNVFADWQPAKEKKRMEKQVRKWKKRL